MLENHTTKDDSMLIAQMTDAHLLAMIHFVLRRISENKEAMSHQKLDPYQSAFYGVPKADVESVARANRQAVRKLYPYLAEAYLRGLDDARQALIDAMGRDSAIATAYAALSSPDFDEYGIDYIPGLDS